VDILIHGGTVLTMGAGGVIRDGAVVVEGNSIIDVGKSDDVKRRYPRYEKLNASGKVVLPGMVNAHHHAAMSLLRGYADDLPLQEWLEKWIWPLETHIEGYDIYTGALLTAVECVLGGCTTVNTMYHHKPDFNEAKAFAEVGLRGAVGHVCFSWRKDEDKRMLLDLAQNWHGKADGLLRVTVDPHAAYTVDPAYMKELHSVCSDLNERFGNPQLPLFWHTHLAETVDEATKVSQAFHVSVDRGVVEYLDDLGVLNQNVVAAHCVHLSNREIRLLAERGVKVAHNAVSNLKLASGISPVPQLLKAGVTVAIGTDSSCSNNSSDMFEAMKTTALLHKGFYGDPTLMSAETVLRMATTEGARSLLWENAIGSLDIGKRADMVIIDFKKPHLTPVYSEVSHLAYAAKCSDVQTVLVNGELIVDNREVMTINQYRVMEMAEKARERLLTRLQA